MIQLTPLFATGPYNEGFPSLTPDTEHACVITEINPSNDTMTIVHWGTTYHNVSVNDFYQSMNALNDIRSPEFYRENVLFPKYSKEKYQEI